MNRPDPGTLRQRELICEVAHTETLRFFRKYAPPEHTNKDYQEAYLEFFPFLVDVVMTFIARDTRSLRLAEPSIN